MMRRVASWIILLIGLILLWLVFLRLVGLRSPGYLILVTVVYAGTVFGLWLVARRVTPRDWLLVLAGLFVPTTLLMEDAGNPLSLGETIIKIAIFLWPSIALIIAVSTYAQRVDFRQLTDARRSGQPACGSLLCPPGGLSPGIAASKTLVCCLTPQAVHHVWAGLVLSGRRGLLPARLCLSRTLEQPGADPADL